MCRVCWDIIYLHHLRLLSVGMIMEIVMMLGHRRKRWAIIMSALDQRIVFFGRAYCGVNV